MLIDIGAFLFCAIVVWFIIGMIMPSLALPPFLLKILEENAYRPSRKIVLQWSCIFIVGLFALALLIGSLKQTNYSVNQKIIATDSDMVISDAHKLLQEENDAFDSKQDKCKAIVMTDLPRVRTLLKELNVSVKEVEIASIKAEINDMRMRLQAESCVN